MLAAVELAAAARFRDAGLPEAADAPPLPRELVEAARREGRAWVAVDAAGAVVGFVVAAELDGAAHVEEVDVLPGHGGRGLGRRLLEAVEGWARARGLGSVTLTTFRDVPWNAPWYARLGFRVVEPGGPAPGLRARLHAEAERWGPGAPRVAMRREVGGAAVPGHGS